MGLFHIDASKGWRGGQRQSFFLVRELKQKGYPVFMVVQPESPLHRRILEIDLPVFPLKMRNEIDIIAALKLARTMRRNHCVLAHFYDDRALAVGSTAANRAKVPIRIISRRVGFPLKRNFFIKRKYRNNIDKVIAPSEGVRLILLRGGIRSDSIKVIPHAIDFSPFEKASSDDYLRREFSFAPDDFLVGILAHLADHTGCKHLIQTTKILKEYTDKIKIIVLGEGPLELDVRWHSRDLSVDDLVCFLGFREDIPQILSSLDLFVLSSYLEGFGSSVLEAMACRLPVVATRTGNIPRVMVHGKTGLLVPPHNPSSLAKAILRLYKDRDLTSRLGQRGYEVVQRKFSAQSMAERVIDVYEREAFKKGINLFGNE